MKPPTVKVDSWELRDTGIYIYIFNKVRLMIVEHGKEESDYVTLEMSEMKKLREILNEWWSENYG